MIEPWALPSSWRWAEWQSVARVASNLVDPVDYAQLPHIAPNHIESQTGRLLPYRTVAEDGVISSKHLFRPGQVLYSKIRPYLAKVAMADFAGLCSADMYPVETELDARFLKWWMLTPEFTRLSSGEQARTVLPKINKHALGLLPVPVAPLDEQRRIVAILEDHLSRLDAAEAYLRSSERRVEAWRSAATQRELWVGEPLERPVGELLREAMRNGRSDRAAKGAESGIRTLTLTAVTRNQFTNEFTKLTVTPPAIAQGLWLEPGDILVQRSNTPELVGTAARYDGPERWAIFPDLLIRLRPDESMIDGRFLVAALRSEKVHRTLRSRAKGLAGSMPKIDQRSIAQTTVPVPSRTRQREAVGQVKAIEESAAAAVATIARQRLRSAGLRRSLLAAAFSGRLTGSASELPKAEEMIGA